MRAHATLRLGPSATAFGLGLAVIVCAATAPAGDGGAHAAFLLARYDAWSALRATAGRLVEVGATYRPRGNGEHS